MDNQDEVQTEAIVSDSKVEVDNQSDDAVETGFIGPMRFLEELRDVLNHLICSVNEVLQLSGMMFAAALTALIFLIGNGPLTGMYAISTLMLSASILMGVPVLIMGGKSVVGSNINMLVDFHNERRYDEMLNYEVNSRIIGIHSVGNRYYTMRVVWHIQCLVAIMGLIILMVEVFT